MQCQKRTDTTFACPLVGRRDLERRQAMHRERLTRQTSSIDTRPPAAMPHLTLYGRDYAAKKRATTEAAFSDLKMIQSIAKTMTRPVKHPPRKGPISLNADSRKTEIFRIMKENHRLLDRLENLEPIVSTTDLVRDYEHKQRYKILTSHSKRLAGEYDNEVERIRTEDKAASDAMNRSVQARLAKHRLKQSGNMSGSMSAPSLTPLAASDPGPGLVGMGSASPSTKPRVRAKPTITKPVGGFSGGGVPTASSSSSSVPRSPAPAASTWSPGPAVSTSAGKEAPPPPPPPAPNASESSEAQVAGKRNSKVSFSGNEDESKRESLGEFQKTPANRHSGGDLGLEEETFKAAPHSQAPVIEVAQVESPSVQLPEATTPSATETQRVRKSPRAARARTAMFTEAPEEETQAATNDEETKTEEQDAPPKEETKNEELDAPSMEEAKKEEQDAPPIEEAKKEEQDAPAMEEAKNEEQDAPPIEEAKKDEQDAPPSEEVKNEEQAAPPNEEAEKGALDEAKNDVPDDQPKQEEVLPTDLEEDKGQVDDNKQEEVLPTVGLPTDLEESKKEEVENEQEYSLNDFEEADATLDSNNMSKALPEETSAEDVFETSKDT